MVQVKGISSYAEPKSHVQTQNWQVVTDHSPGERVKHMIIRGRLLLLVVMLSAQCAALRQNIKSPSANVGTVLWVLSRVLSECSLECSLSALYGAL